MYKSLKSILLGALLLLTASIISNAQTEAEIKNIKQIILRSDSLFWIAYNNCDVSGMEKFLTSDLEFYHDKGGLTLTSEKLIALTKTNLCSNENFRLRREAIKGTVKFFPLGTYGAILSGDHYFYINEKGKKEYRDGKAKFTHVWIVKDNEWRMHRILSYDHGPADRK